MKLIVGLGNPGKEYQGTRHNVGFEAVDRLADLYESKWTNDEDRMSLISKASINDEIVMLAKPQTFMNKSGDAVLALMQYYKMKTKDVLIIHDDMDIEPGHNKLVAQAGPAGHNGIDDIQGKLKTEEISRIRIGVGRPSGGLSAETWVLTQPDDFDAENIEEAIQDTVSTALAWNRGN